jgi:hypothetical protein
VAYVGENGVESDVAYRFDNGIFVAANAHIDSGDEDL